MSIHSPSSPDCKGLSGSRVLVESKRAASSSPERLAVLVEFLRHVDAARVVASFDAVPAPPALRPVRQVMDPHRYAGFINRVIDMPEGLCPPISLVARSARSIPVRAICQDGMQIMVEVGKAHAMLEADYPEDTRASDSEAITVEYDLATQPIELDFQWTERPGPFELFCRQNGPEMRGLALESIKRQLTREANRNAEWAALYFSAKMRRVEDH